MAPQTWREAATAGFGRACGQRTPHTDWKGQPVRGTRLRPPSLSSTSARRLLGHREEPIFGSVLQAIDNLASLYDGLDAVRRNQSPLHTAEANALAYRKQHEAAAARAEALVKAQIAKLVDYEDNAKRAAFQKAGLSADPRGGDEIRAALRAMSQRQRDAAVAAAADRGDAGVLAAIMHSPSPILTGAITVPIETLTRQFVERAAPELNRDLTDVEAGVETLGMAWQAFQKASAELRDIGAEQRGDVGEAAARDAAAALSAAMQGAA